MRNRNERHYFRNTIIELFALLNINDDNIDIERDYIEVLNQYRLIELENSIVMTHPEILKEWDYKKNGKLKPENFTAGSNEIVWWVCFICNESYQSSINRKTKGVACPYCANKKIKVGINDFETYCKNNHLEHLLREWDSKKNDSTPNEYFHGTLKKVWWKCEKCGYSWQASLNNRTRGRGCWRCSGHRAIVCVETEEYFETPLMAAQKFGKTDATNITLCCKGKTKTAYGFHWEYAE
jgi:DNA-directed RNA polymerase subunit RPC12/RpoP